MAAPKKQRRIAENHESSSDSDSEADDNNENEVSDMGSVMVDFEVMCPEETDRPGIKNLLQQVFLKAHINVSELAGILIEQNDITGILKQAKEDEDMEDDDDMDINFGIFSIINLTTKKDMECIKQIQEYLLNHCQKNCSADQYSSFKNILEDPVRHVGLIISERFINIPPLVAVPQYNGLGHDMTIGKEKNKALDFAYFLLICKISIFQDTVYYANPEEELIAEEAEFSFDFEVREEHDTGLAGTWVEDDEEGDPKRRVLLWPASKWSAVCEKLHKELGDGSLSQQQS